MEQLPPVFWQRQRLAVLARVEQPAAPAFRPAAAILALGALLLLGVLLVSPAPRMPATAVIPPPVYPFRPEDEQLLREIHFWVNRVEPRALAPAALLLPDQSKEVQQQ